MSTAPGSSAASSTALILHAIAMPKRSAKQKIRENAEPHSWVSQPLALRLPAQFAAMGLSVSAPASSPG